MTICDKFRQLFKRSGRSVDDLVNEMRKDIQNVRFSLDDFEKKYRKWKDREIKKIPSLPEKEKKERIEIAQVLEEFNAEVLNLAPPIKRKFEIAKQYLKEYQDALRNSLDRSK